MDTKWRKFSRSRAVKAALVVLYIACFALVGVIMGYAPANGYGNGDYYNCIDSLISDSYMESGAFTKMLIDDIYNAKYEIRLNRSSQNYVNGKKQIELDFYCSARVDGDYYSAGKSADYVYRIDYTGGIAKLQCDKGLSNRLEDVLFDSTDIMRNAGDYIEIGYTSARIASLERSWNIMRYNACVIILSSAALAVVGLALMIMICRVSGEAADGTITMRKCFSVPYELSLAAWICVFGLYLGLLLSAENFESLFKGENGKMLFMAFCGVISAISAAAALYMVVCFAVRRKNNTAKRGSILAWAVLMCARLAKCVYNRVIKRIIGLVPRFFRFVKEVLTGELYAADTAARKLIWLDAIMIIATCMVFFLTLIFRQPAIILLELLFAGFFIYGRTLLIKDEALLEKQIKAIYYGQYDYKPQLSKNSPYAQRSEQLAAISSQYRKGIEETVKAERTKMELVTNVSHDLKTPLTSIIGYIELLSKEELPPEAAEHVRVLQRKSERLKNIVADVFELAKTTSGEITVERAPLDLTKLSYQTLGEMEDSISSSGLDIKVNICEPPVIVVSDGKRLYRVIQNLLDNALKYSLRGTRIYYTLEKRGDNAFITIKNIASYEMTFTKEEILERFTRADKARSTEGTGLGLSIAQGFTLACGGSFDIEIDGDMFKVVLGFPMKSDEPVTGDE